MAHPDWTPFHARLHRTLRARPLLPKQSRSLIAVSGGQDSLCLVRLLLDLQPKWNWQLAVVHCNHGWRNDSTANAEYVAHLAQTWNLPFYCLTATDLPATEAAARTWRYQALTELALEQNYTRILTGHTASDRAETLLYNLVRGSGADGLQALTWQRELATGLVLVRPLLEFTRSETEQVCIAANLKIWQDSTNEDWHYARNRIRQELIPYLQTHFNPQVEQALAQTAELLRSEVAYLDEVTADWWQRVVVREEGQREEGQGKTRCKLNRSVLKTAPLALQRRLIRQVLQTFLPIAPNFEQIEKVLALIAAPNRSQTDPFSGGTIAQVEGEWIVLLEGRR